MVKEKIKSKAKETVKKAAKTAAKTVAKVIMAKIVPILLPILIVAFLIVVFFVSAAGIKESSSSDGSTSVDGVYGDTIQEKVWWALKDAGFNDSQVAGVMGNIQQESSFNPNAISGVVGLCQWKLEYLGKDLKAYADSKGVELGDEDTQIEFIVGWLANTGPAVKYINRSNGPQEGQAFTYSGVYYKENSWAKYKETGKKDDDIEYCTMAFCANYEKCGEWEANFSNRISSAKSFYEQFHGKKKPENTQGETEDIEVNSSNYVMLKNASKVVSTVKNNGFYQASNNAYGDKCLAFAYVYAYSAYSGDMSYLQKKQYSTGNGDVTGSFGSSIKSDNKSDLVKQMYGQLKAGKACVLQVVGTTDNGNPKRPTGRHYVALVGYKKGVTESTIKDTDLLIIDDWDGLLKPVVQEFTSGRYMFNAKSSVGINYEYGYEYIKMKN